MPPGIEPDTLPQKLHIYPARLAEIIVLLNARSTKRHYTILNAKYSPSLSSLPLFALCAAPGERCYAACWMSSAKLTIRPITFDWITPSTRTSCGGELSSRPGIVVASFMRTNEPPPQTWTFTPTHASLVSVPISHGTGPTGPSQTTTSLCPVQLVSRSSSLLPLRSILGQHPLLVAIFCSIAITYS